jgi:hypothetical protein
MRKLGAVAVRCDVYDYERLLRVLRATRPRIVVNFLSDLSTGSTSTQPALRLHDSSCTQFRARTR